MLFNVFKIYSLSIDPLINVKVIKTRRFQRLEANFVHQIILIKNRLKIHRTRTN